MQLIFLVKISQILINYIKENPFLFEMDFLLYKKYLRVLYSFIIKHHNQKVLNHEVTHDSHI